MGCMGLEQLTRQVIRRCTATLVTCSRARDGRRCREGIASDFTDCILQIIANGELFEGLIGHGKSLLVEAVFSGRI